MTLAIAWRSNGRIHLASDSRISLGNNQSVDIGIKVMAIPIRVIGEVEDPGNPDPVIFSQRYGFCFAGSLVSAYTLKELLEELLQSMQYLGEPKTLSFDAICKSLVGYSSRISSEVCQYMFENGRYEFFLTGYCPRENSLRAAKFSFTHEDGMAKGSFSEILRNEQSYEAMGSGTLEFKQRVGAVTFRDILLTLNSIIDDKRVNSVGGDIQYGSFDEDKNFSISGLIRQSDESATLNGVQYGPQVIIRHRYRGFQFFDKNWRYESEQFLISPSFFELKVPSNDQSNEQFLGELQT